MKYIQCLGFGIILLFTHSCRNRGDEIESLDTYVVMVSLDGFRWDYGDLYHTPNLDKMAMAGVKAEKLIPSFPTKTFPNHYSIATGLYPDHHGIISNSFYASDLDGIYRIGDTEMVTDPDAYFGEPIWVTAEEQGVKTASYFWVGSEAPIQGTYPSYWEKYDGRVPYIERVDQVIDWLELPLARRPGLVLLYFDEPDHTGHSAGPEHPSTGEVVEYLDSVIGYLRSEIADLKYGDRINLIVLSDHGMGPVSAERYVNLFDHVQTHWIDKIIGGNPVYLIEPVEAYKDSITDVLNGLDGVTAWQKEDIPARLHYGTHPRFPGIVVVADSLWSIGTGSDPSGYSGGAHGYDNSFTDMHTIFYAEGPAFKCGVPAPAFPNVDVYALLAWILDIEPAETDGEFSRVQGMLSLQSSGK